MQRKIFIVKKAKYENPGRNFTIKNVMLELIREIATKKGNEERKFDRM